MERSEAKEERDYYRCYDARWNKYYKCYTVEKVTELVFNGVWKAVDIIGKDNCMGW